MFEASPGNLGEDPEACRIVDARPGGNFIKRAEAALAQSATCIHLANVDAGRGDHSN
jgi:hypothetical protein